MTRTLEQIDTELARLAAEAARRLEQQLDASDCALSSWADGITTSMLLMERELILAGGKAAFLTLVTEDGQPVRARLITTKYQKLCWALTDDRGKFTGEFLPVPDSESEPGTPYVARSNRKLRARGYRQIAQLRPAEVRMVGAGTGLSGTAWPAMIDPATGQGSCAWLASEEA